MFGPIEEYDLFVRPRYLPDVRRPNVRMSHLSQNCGKTNPTLLNCLAHFSKSYEPSYNAEEAHNPIRIQRHIQKMIRYELKIPK